MHTFFCENITESTAHLNEIDSKHAVKVLRLKEGDVLRLIDGKGTEAFGNISIAHPKHCEVEVDRINRFPIEETEIIIALSPTKSNDRTEWFLEKATEIGMTQFVPIISSNSERKKFNSERWHKIVLAAVKQSKRVWTPIISEPIAFSDFVKRNEISQAFIAHCEEHQKVELQKIVDRSSDRLILIGPEGDFSTEEIQQALNHGFRPVALGTNRLRTETAGIVACTIMKFD